MNRRNIMSFILAVVGIAIVIMCSAVFLNLKELFRGRGSVRVSDDSALLNDVGVIQEILSQSEATIAEDTEAVPPATDVTSGKSSAEVPGEGESGSSFFQKLASHQDVRILVIGDSVGLGIGASDVSNRWDHMLKTYLERKYESNVTVQNECFGGCPSYGVYVRLKKLAQQEGDFDLTIVCCGQNDSNDGFSEIYEALLRNLNIEYPKSSVICILESTQKAMTNKMLTVQNLADYYWAGVADTVKAFAKDYELLTLNGFYPNDEGQEMYFRTLINLIDKLVSEGCGVKIGGKGYYDVPLPLRPEVASYDHLSFYPASELVRADELHYDLNLPYADSEGRTIGPVAGRLGIEMFVNTGEFPVRALVDGVYLGETNIINYTEFEEARYYNFGGFEAGQQIRIEFDTQEAADRFTGIYLSTAE